jgi:hypothetical protein
MNSRQLRRGGNSLRAFLFAALLLGAWPASGQDVRVSPILQTGDQFRLELIRIRENTQRPQDNGKSRTVVDVRVVSADTDGFVLEWVPGETTFNNPLVAKDPLVAAASQAALGIRFVLRLNSDGELTGLVNQAEIAPKLKNMMDTIVRDLASRLPANERKNFQNMVGQLMSPTTLISSATNEAQIYFGLNGMELGDGENLAVELEHPSPLGSGVIPATFRIRVDSTTSDSAVLKTTTTYDAAALVRMTQALAQQAGRGIPAEELAKIPPMQMSDDGSYVFNKSLGLMREVIVNRLIAAGGMQRLDGWEISLLNSPTRDAN